ncbi:hypothetical protein RUMCAL_00368 [Ruminococcus callidus ATCC 27760]|uniref:Uncharacterized protein n=1 Tax=Ruminococcus callidus ATCC 27760 TaxID=411473 RepID=U2KFI6_9FIRM|nr:hypothetical protein RUMCAL_00368 [Ruminococcus callidus ATCC 27760]
MFTGIRHQMEKFILVLQEWNIQNVAGDLMVQDIKIIIIFGLQYRNMDGIIYNMIF